METPSTAASQNHTDRLPILLVSRGLFHPHLFVRRELYRILAEVPGAEISRAAALEDLSGPQLNTFQAAVLFFHERQISPAALDAWEVYLQAGGGVLALHAAAASYKESDRYTKLLGGRFTSHGPVQEITITTRPPGQQLFGPLPDFTIRDEFYRMETRTDITILFTARQNGLEEPFVWIRQHGSGRLCYLAAGHTTASLRHPSVQHIIQRAVQWCAGQIRVNGEAGSE